MPAVAGSTAARASAAAPLLAELIEDGDVKVHVDGVFALPDAPAAHHLLEGGQHYDVLGYTKEQLIGDILSQYEKHMHFLHIAAGR